MLSDYEKRVEWEFVSQMDQVGIPVCEMLRVVKLGLSTEAKELVEACAMLLFADFFQCRSDAAAHVAPGEVEVASD